MQLESLARGEAQRAVGVAPGNLIERQPLLWRTDAAGQAGADHETVGRLQLLQAALLAQVAVVLLVAAVQLEELCVVFAQRAGNRVRQTLDDGAAQTPAGRLDAFNG